jgi:4'-phosphopantetheinyl transferase
MSWLSIQEIPLVQWTKEESFPFKTIPVCDCWKISIPGLEGLVVNKEPILVSDELERAQRYFQEKDRLRFKLCRISLRILLAKYLQTDPACLVFREGPNKKPFFNDELHFNVSHSEEMILITVSSKPVGVDVEKIRFRFPLEELIREIASPEELEIYRESSDTLDFFYYLWTRKESLLKASSKGIEDSLNRLNVLDGRRTLPAELIGSDQDWFIGSFKMNGDYRGCIASSYPLEDCRFLDASGFL